MPQRRLTTAMLCMGFWPSHAQTLDTATLSGTVADTTRAVLAGAVIHLTNPQSSLDRTVISDPQGRFAFQGVPTTGDYTLTAARDGFSETRRDHLAFVPGSTATLSVELGVAGTASELTIAGAANEVRVDQPQLGQNLTHRQIDDTPIPNRRLTFLPLLNAANRPAINQGDIFMNQFLFTTNGAGRRQTWFEVDGATGNDSWGRQTIFTTFPLAAVAEVTILTNSFSAEYGASTGSVVNLVTRSGSRDFHGEALGLWRPSGPEAALSGFIPANAASGNDITNDRLYQGSGALSGPLGRATTFFVAGEWSGENRASPVTSILAPGDYIGRYRDELGFLRLDRQLSPDQTAFFRGDVDAFFDTNPNGTVGGQTLPSVARVFRRRTYTAELGETAVLSPRLVNSLRVQFLLGSPITQFDPVVSGTQFVVPISSGGTFTSGTSQSALLLNRQYEVRETLSARLGRQQLSLGGQMIAAHNGGDSKEFGGPIYQGRFTYNPCTLSVALCESPSFLNNIANVANYTQSYGNAAYTVDDVLWALFAQDDLRATSRLTLNAGLRYERQTFTDSNLLFAPRAGLVYDLTGASRTVIRAGFGLYASQVIDNSEANYTLTGPTGVFNYTAAPGQAGFPNSIASAPLPSFPAGAAVPLRSLYIRPGLASYYDRFFPTDTLLNYPARLLDPYSEQWTLSLEHQLATGWLASIDYIGTHTLRITRPLDLDPPSTFTRTAPGQVRTAQAANCTRPYWIAWYAQHGATCNPAKAGSSQPPYSVIQTDAPDGTLHYDALDLNLTHAFAHGFALLASYAFAHTLDTVDPDTNSQNSNDPRQTGAPEYGNAIYDQRHRFVLSGMVTAPFAVHLGGIATLAGGLPYNVVTGATNSGDTGATTDRPIVNGVLLGRNTGRGAPIYDIAPFIARTFPLAPERLRLDLRVEAFNVLNHANFIGYSSTYGNAAGPGPGFGAPLPGVASQLPARSLQFAAKVSF